ncbi:hypothetical protein [Aurantiacibacter gangjinensis]|uniref:Uncharacterized protein n=1 Tax=Aurantiacibacter gangjinensis TaxID=502682 RepID=A0A0G9MRK6_9SPHN|nr:hypothetical protein [Aurantiacibacter gangjinensis]APE28028.1 hypothetical protein BMF35_a1199 [Aurantiacibacter gangjinensis]KLE31958.1 hypothetical protein AAW01_10995 [Aurantiacibacter gangjinensis]
MARLSGPQRPNRGGAFETWTVRLLVPALILALLAIVLAVLGFRGPDWRAWFDTEDRGEWRAVTIGGLDVSNERMSIIIADGEIVGGRDGCNFWSYDGPPDPVTGERGMHSTLAGCPDTPELRAYNAVGHYRADFRLESEDRLVVSYNGVTGQFIRWTDAMEQAEREADERAMEAARAAEPPPARRPAVPAAVPPPAPPAQPMPEPPPPLDN